MFSSQTASLGAADMCLFFSFQGRTRRCCRLSASSTSRALQGKGASLLSRGSSYAPSQRELSPPHRAEGGRSPVSSALPTSACSAAQRTLSTRRPAFPSPAPKNASLSGNGQTSAPRGQPGPVQAFSWPCSSPLLVSPSAGPQEEIQSGGNKGTRRLGVQARRKGSLGLGKHYIILSCSSTVLLLFSGDGVLAPAHPQEFVEGAWDCVQGFYGDCCPLSSGKWQAVQHDRTDFPQLQNIWTGC